MIIPYYQKQKEEKEKKELQRLRVRCQSYIEAGYYSDPKCEQLYLTSYNGFSSANSFQKTTAVIAPLFLLSFVLLLV
jgi:hypothetical protein